MVNEDLQNYLKELAEKQHPFKEVSEDLKKEKAPDLDSDSDGEPVSRFKRILKQLPGDE